MHRRILGALFAVFFLVPGAFAQDYQPDVPAVTEEPELPIDIPFEKFVLDNGLTVIVHEDRKAPIVAVNIWYHVGSKNEKLGKTGFAHLFEHLMFNGSENNNEDYFQVLEAIGATDLNGTTNPDRTNYFQNVPSSALDLAMWMESDRMGHLLGAVDQARLDEQRGVVQNEKRQGENQPYGVTRQLLTDYTYPPGHPYSWTTIGSMEDLDAASLEDVQEWFRTYYGPSNTVVVLAGDIDVDTAREKAQLYFGDIEPGPPVAKVDTWIAKMTGEKRATVQDRVPQSRVYMRWNVPEWGNEELWQLDLVSDVLARGKTSRLYKRLVYDDQIATDASAFVSPREIGSQFGMTSTARPGVDLGTVEAALREELERFIAEGPSDQEVERVRAQFISSFVRGAERIGGFGGKSDILAQNEVYGGTPDAWKERMRIVQTVTAEELRHVAEKWLSDGVFVLEVHPFQQYTAASEGAARDALPEAAAPPAAEFPVLQRAELSNGLKVVLAERHTAPIVDLDLLLDAGYASDQFGVEGTAQLAMAMLDEGTATRTSLEIADELAMLGASIGAGSNLDVSTVSLSALQLNLDPSLELFADVVLNPAFPEADFSRLKQQQLIGIQREKVSPVSMALRVFPPIMYGDDHAYGMPLTGSGTEAGVSGLMREDLVGFHETWFKPNNGTLVVTGAISMDDLLPKLEAAFGDWAPGDTPEKNVGQVAMQEGGTVYLMDRPGAQQSVIFAGHVAPPKANPNELAIQTMNTILGGAFISRVNMNLREEKGWSYGAATLMLDAQGQRPFLAYAPVQSDKTADSMKEIVAELSGILGAEPITDQEVSFAKSNQTLSLPGRWETIGAVSGSVIEIVQYGLDEDWYQGYADRINALSKADLTEAAGAVIHPDNLLWVVVGDRANIEQSIKEAGFTDIRYIDGDGNPVGTD